MRQLATPPDCDRILVVLPSWIGDGVMATPTLRALRGLYPDARITALARPAVKPILDSCPWLDRITTTRLRRRERRHRASERSSNILELSRRLSAGRFDMAVLLPNGFRTALLTRLAGIDRRIGYERDGRSMLLTDRLLPRRRPGGFLPVPTRDYYLGIVRYLGARGCDTTLSLSTRPEHDAHADACLERAGYEIGGARPLVMLNPGANFGAAKIWPAERFAAAADACVDRFNAVVAVTGAPKEQRIIDEVKRSARHPIIDLQQSGITLATLKSAIRRASVMITNDTGPRHIAAALGVPVVTIFGPTDPAWTEIDFVHERQVRVEVPCGPCQQKRCPLEGTPDFHICMTHIDTEMVVSRAGELLEARAHGEKIASEKIASEDVAIGERTG